MTPMTKTFLATLGQGLARASFRNDQWSVEYLLGGQTVHCLAGDPRPARFTYAGTRGDGVWRSSDAGQTWTRAGLAGRTVKALAVSPSVPGTVYAGTKPPALFVSRDAGESWDELTAFQRVRAWWWRSPAERDLGAYIQAIALPANDPAVIVAGIEAGAVVRSADGGRSWEGHRPGALRDCHSLWAHAADGRWMYEGGGSGAGVAVSRDAGRTWQQPQAGLDRHYGWAVAADPARPEVWYASLSPLFSWHQPGVPAAHIEGHAHAAIYRSAGGAAWQRLGGGLPEPLDYMPYALLTDPAAPGQVYAGLSNGAVWHSTDHGERWTRLPFNLTSIQRTLLIL